MNAIFTFPPMFNKNKTSSFIMENLFDEMHANQIDIEMNLHDDYTTQNIPSPMGENCLYNTEHSIPQGRQLSRLLLLKHRTRNKALI